MTASNPLTGPYALDADWPLVAFVFNLDGQEHRFRFVCAVLPRDHVGVFRTQHLEILRGTLNRVVRQFADWKNVPCFVVALRPGAEPGIVPYEGDCEQAAEIAIDVLRGMPIPFRLAVDGRDYAIAEFPKEPGADVHRYQVQQVGSAISTSCLARNRAVLELTLSATLSSVVDDQQTTMYLQEAIAFAKGDGPDGAAAAFLSFHYALKLKGNLPPDLVVATGGRLGPRFAEIGRYDFAEAVADATASFAIATNQAGPAVKALHLAGIAAAALGRMNETRAAFDRALAIAGAPRDPLTTLRLHMSYGLALVDFLAHWETEPYYTSGAFDGFAKESIEVAGRHLRRASRLAGVPRDEESGIRRSAIDLDLVRVIDLRGEPERALKALQRLTEHRGFRRTDKTLATALVYEAAIRKKLSDKNRSQRPRYWAEIDRIRAQLLALKSKPGDRFCCFWVLHADALVEQNRGHEAQEELALAYALQQIRHAGGVRAPGPGVALGGLPIIDIVGKLQAAHIRVAASRGTEAPLWKALQIGDASKGWYFRRDLALTGAVSLKGFSSRLASSAAALRSNLLHSTADPRVVHAEYERFVERDLRPAQAATLRRQTRFEAGVRRADLQRLFKSVPDRLAFIAFYARPDRTHLYLLTDSDAAPEVVTLEVDVTALERAVHFLHAGIAGSSLYPSINPLRPELQERFFRPFRQLGDAFAEVVTRLLGCNRIIVSPHGLWHGIPVHALLLPMFWNRGKTPAIGYAPSLCGYSLLQRRAEVRARRALRPIGLATVPAREDDSALFREQHGALAAVFGRAGRPLAEDFGARATVARVADTLQTSGIQHLLAHGLLQTGADAMNSGLLLAGESGLPSRDLLRNAGGVGPHLLSANGVMAQGVAAAHVTLQACSLGRVQPAWGDELWGVTRALLAGGAGSVLAPMWDIDLVSSSALLVRFYENWLVKGQDKWRAFTEAQHHIACEPKLAPWSHFYHWAPFQMVGC